MDITIKLFFILLIFKTYLYLSENIKQVLYQDALYQYFLEVNITLFKILGKIKYQDIFFLREV